MMVAKAVKRPACVKRMQITVTEDLTGSSAKDMVFCAQLDDAETMRLAYDPSPDAELRVLAKSGFGETREGALAQLARKQFLTVEQMVNADILDIAYD